MQEYSEIINGNWSNSTGIFRGLIQYDRSELNSTDFISVFQDGLNYTMKRDCSVSDKVYCFWYCMNMIGL